MKVLMIALSAVFISACSSLLPSNISVSTDSQLNANAQLPPQGKMVTAEEFRRDFNQLKELLDSTHPEPNFTMNLVNVKSKIDELASQLNEPISQLKAWQHMAQLNPYFNDGHMAIFYPLLNQDFNQHKASGGTVFPVKVRIDELNRVFIDTLEHEGVGLKYGQQIKSINGVPAAQVSHEIVSRMHGDSIAHRAALASDRFEKMYWLMNGEPRKYQIEVIEPNQTKKHLLAGKQVKEKQNEPEITDFLSRKLLDNNIGYLRIDRFYYAPHHEQAFFNFIEETWLEFNKAEVQDVIIDVRANPGGTDHYWQLGIAPYVAKDAFSFFSKYKIRLTERNLKLGPVAGELGTILEGPYNQLIPVSGKEKLKIPGKAYLLMGPLSYSSTVLFLTAFQDSGQAVIAGQRSGVRSCTTGRIHSFELTGSKLEVTVPTLIFTRAAGEANCHEPIEPDLVLSTEIIESVDVVERLAQMVHLQRVNLTGE